MTRAVLVTLALLLAACSDPQVALVPVPAPDVATLASSVRNRVNAARAEFDRVAASKPRNEALGNAYGELGMTYHAQDMVAAAEAAYRNARALAPRDKRWPYLLAHLYADASRLPEAIVQFEAVLAIDPADTPTQVYLAQLLVQQGELERAGSLFDQAMAKPEARAAAHTGLGKVALAQQKYAEAAGHFEKALQISPGSSRLRQPLAAAYRGQGEAAKAEQALRGYSPAGLEPGVPDKVVDQLAEKVASPHVLISRGKRFGQQGRFDLAEPAFRVAVEGDPKNAEALANLGISLANLNRDEEARKYLEQAVALDPADISARFSLAVVHERLRNESLAVPQYEAVLARDPAHLQALAQLADLHLRAGRAEAAAQLYRRASAGDPASPRFLFSHAMASVRAGRYADARASLETLTQRDKDPVFRNAYAKVLATAPETAVRDGKRALALARALFTETQHNADVAQTLAMALAESGAFDEAVQVQEGALAVFRQNGPAWLVPLLERNLALYRQKKPSREGWVAEDPVFQPRSPAVRVTKTS
jgi:tetratricopeptide (TPR) repeat protein